MFSFVRNDNYPSHWWHIFFMIVLPVYGLISLQPAVSGLCFDKLSLMSSITCSCRWNVGKSDDRQKPPKLQGLSILILKEDLYVLRFVSCFWIHHFQNWVFNKLLNKFIISTVCLSLFPSQLMVLMHIWFLSVTTENSSLWFLIFAFPDNA
jgi:hypothetical protein